MEQPRAEPEIIPPGDVRMRPARRTSSDGTHRIYVARIGPFGFAMLAFAIAMAVTFLLLLIGAFLIVIPFAGLLLAAVVVISLLRGSFRRPY
jgi:hypothetical protein